MSLVCDGWGQLIVSEQSLCWQLNGFENGRTDCLNAKWIAEVTVIANACEAPGKGVQWLRCSAIAAEMGKLGERRSLRRVVRSSSSRWNNGKCFTMAWEKCLVDNVL